MKIKTSISIIIGCLVIFLFIMLPIFLSVQDKKDEYVASITGSSFLLKDVNNNTITEKSFEGQATALFFGFTNCPDVCPMTLNKLDYISPSNLSNNVKASAVDPAKPATTSLFSIFLTFEAVLFTTVFPILTCPSPATTTSLFFLTNTIVVIAYKWILNLIVQA